jgi:hypothetical protein
MVFIIQCWFDKYINFEGKFYGTVSIVWPKMAVGWCLWESNMLRYCIINMCKHIRFKNQQMRINYVT